MKASLHSVTLLRRSMKEKEKQKTTTTKQCISKGKRWKGLKQKKEGWTTPEGQLWDVHRGQHFICCLVLSLNIEDGDAPSEARGLVSDFTTVHVVAVIWWLYVVYDLLLCVCVWLKLCALKTECDSTVCICVCVCKENHVSYISTCTRSETFIMHAVGLPPNSRQSLSRPRSCKSTKISLVTGKKHI